MHFVVDQQCEILYVSIHYESGHEVRDKILMKSFVVLLQHLIFSSTFCLRLEYSIGKITVSVK